jgi:acylphosphatase
MEPDGVTVRFLVTGRVQGVFFRASTKAEADRLGLSGYARNLPDGRVEVIAAGSGAAIDALATWLGEGPPLSKVERVERTAADGIHVSDGFGIRH